MPPTWDLAVVALVVGTALFGAWRLVRRKQLAQGCGACPAGKKN